MRVWPENRTERLAVKILLSLLILFPITLCHDVIRDKALRLYKYKNLTALTYPYDRLKPGMSEQQVLELFARDPDCVCMLADNRVLYFRRGMPADDYSSQNELKIDGQDDLPKLYGNAQLLFDTEGHLSAFTEMGEGGFTYTREGRYGGAGFETLDPKIFERLRHPAIPVGLQPLTDSTSATAG